MKKIILLSLVMLSLSIALMAVDMKIDNIDRPDVKSDWQATETRFLSPDNTPVPVFSENFEGGVMPTGWVVVSSHPDTSWKVVNSSSNMFPPNYGTWWVCFDPYAYGYVNETTEQLYTPAVECSTWDAGYIRYDFDMEDYSGNGDFNVYISTFNGSWSADELLINHTSDLASTDTLDLSSYFPAESIKICFEFTMTASTAWGIGVDNVEIGYIAPPDYDCVLLDITNPSSNLVIPPAPFMPEIMAVNAGTLDMAGVDFICIIGDSTGNIYFDTISIDTLHSNDTTNIQFDTFTPAFLCEYDILFYSLSGLDIYPQNDTLDMYFRTFDVDMAVTDCSPGGSNISANLPYDLNATYVNNATMATSFTAICELYDNTPTLIYIDSLYIPSIQPNETLTVKFSYFNSGLPAGSYFQNVFADTKHDLNTADNAIYTGFNAVNGTWENITGTSLIPTQWPGVCQDENSIWLLGGLASSAAQTYVQRYDTINGWTHVTDLPFASFGQACAIIDSHLYVIGGCDGGFITYNTVYIYDMAGDSWTLSSSTYPERLGGMGGGVYNGKMYLVGGLLDGSFLGRTPTYCYDPAADTAGGTPWDTLTDCLRGSNGLALGANFFGNPASVNAPIIVGGDYQGIHTYYEYQPDADTAGGTPWTDITSFSYGNIGTKTPMIMWDNNNAYLVGGDVYGTWGGYYPGWTYYYNFASSTWTDMACAQFTGLEGSGGGILGDYLYSAGGTIGSSAIDPAPFERTFKIGAGSSLFQISYTYPIDRQLQAPINEPVIVAFTQPVDTTFGFSYNFTPNPGLLTHYFSSGFDTLYIFHDALLIDTSYYVEVTAYDTLGNGLVAGNIPNPFGFNTGMTGILDGTNTYTFGMNNTNAIGTASVLFNYSLPTNGDIVIDIYNLTGAKVKSLSINNETAGMHSIIWNTGSIPSGIYLYKATFGENVYNGKIAVVK